MTRILVVNHDLDLGGQEVDSLRRLGYDVTECTGPTRNRCPILAGMPCELAEEADALVYDAWASGDAEGARLLIQNLRDIHPETPIVLTTPGLELDWEEQSGPHAVTILAGQPTGARLAEAIQAAIATCSGATVAHQTSETARSATGADLDGQRLFDSTAHGGAMLIARVVAR
ncbi:MAG: hypothetical protein HYX54_06885 [Chloroflexi bacterium]|nr:hypothetical protein [Chloroflexota bacterium]